MESRVSERHARETVVSIFRGNDSRGPNTITPVSLTETLAGAAVMAPMTKGSNLPYRRLAVELGARVLVSEMTVARRLKQKRKSEFALIRRAPDEPCFGVQLAGTNPEEMAWAAALVESRGADFVDVNLGCPIDHFTRKGMGAALGRQPSRVRRIVETMAKGVTRVPVTVKIRLGWNDEMRNHVELARAAVDGGAQAVFVHGRTRDARYRQKRGRERSRRGGARYARPSGPTAGDCCGTARESSSRCAAAAARRAPTASPGRAQRTLRAPCCRRPSRAQRRHRPLPLQDRPSRCG